MPHLNTAIAELSYIDELTVSIGEEVAEVELVESRGGDPVRQLSGFVAWNRGKRSITLDLKQKGGAEAILALICAQAQLNEVMIIALDQTVFHSVTAGLLLSQDKQDSMRLL